MTFEKMKARQRKYGPEFAGKCLLPIVGCGGSSIRTAVQLKRQE
jgi:hypothetical protein